MACNRLIRKGRRCGRPSSHGWCLRCRATATRRRGRISAAGVCSRCHRPRVYNRRHCAYCHAYKREQALPTLIHNTEYHAKCCADRWNPTAVCCITKQPAKRLWQIGERLSVDRIDPTLGYVVGNCQLMAQSLNSAKGVGSRVPAKAIARLMHKLTRVPEV